MYLKSSQRRHINQFDEPANEPLLDSAVAQLAGFLVDDMKNHPMTGMFHQLVTGERISGGSHHG